MAPARTFSFKFDGMRGAFCLVCRQKELTSKPVQAEFTKHVFAAPPATRFPASAGRCKACLAGLWWRSLLSQKTAKLGWEVD